MTKEEELRTHGKVVIDALAPIVKWKFNDVEQVMLAEFSVDKEKQVMSVLRQLLPYQLNAKSVKKAPDEIKHKAGGFAKLVKNQQLLSEDPSLNPKVMVAWWPWGHGATVSVRLFLSDTREFVPRRNLIQQLLAIFS